MYQVEEMDQVDQVDHVDQVVEVVEVVDQVVDVEEWGAWCQIKKGAAGPGLLHTPGRQSSQLCGEWEDERGADCQSRIDKNLSGL